MRDMVVDQEVTTKVIEDKEDKTTVDKTDQT
jgi:hypothetical protein